MIRRIVADEMWEDCRLRYEMLEGGGRGNLGVSVIKEKSGTRTQATCYRITNSQEKIKAFIEMLIRNKVLPEHLCDVAEDWLYEQDCQAENA